jgi:hypothetical protein
MREAATAVIVYVVYRVLYTFVYRPWTSPLRKLKAPRGGMGIMGHFAEIIKYVFPHSTHHGSHIHPSHTLYSHEPFTASILTRIAYTTTPKPTPGSPSSAAPSASKACFGYITVSGQSTRARSRTSWPSRTSTRNRPSSEGR